METYEQNADYIARMGHKWFNPEKQTEFGRDREIMENVARIPFRIDTLGDLTYLAFSNTSWTPERSAMLTECGYTQQIAALCTEILEQHSDDRTLLELEHFAVRLRQKYIDYLAAHSRCASSAVVGPAKFPTSKAESASKTSDARMREMLEYAESGADRVRKNLGLETKESWGPEVISSDDADAVDKLKAKLEKLRKSHEMGLAGNKVMQSALSNEEKKAKLLEIGFDERELERASYAGFENTRFSTTNILAVIHRIESRIKELEARKTNVTSEIPFTGGRLVDNVEDNRVQLLYDNKPEKDLIEKLKHRGFRWSPRNSAWQRQRTPEALRVAKEIAGLPSDAKLSMSSVSSAPPVEKNESGTEIKKDEIAEVTPVKMPWEMTRAEVLKINLKLRDRVSHYDTLHRGWQFARSADIEGKTPEEKRQNFNRELYHRKTLLERTQKLVQQYDPLKHEKYIRTALEEGKTIPPSVLADYPALQKPERVSVPMPDAIREKQQRMAEKRERKIAAELSLMKHNISSLKPGQRAAFGQSDIHPELYFGEVMSIKGKEIRLNIGPGEKGVDRILTFTGDEYKGHLGFNFVRAKMFQECFKDAEFVSDISKLKAGDRIVFEHGSIGTMMYLGTVISVGPVNLHIRNSENYDYNGVAGTYSKTLYRGHFMDAALVDEKTLPKAGDRKSEEITAVSVPKKESVSPSMAPVEKSKAEKKDDFVKNHLIFGSVPVTKKTETPGQKNESGMEEKTEKETSREKGKKLLEQIDTSIGELEKKIDSPETEKTIREWLACQAKFHTYSERNTFLLAMQAQKREMNLEEVASFRKWIGMKGPNGEKVCVKKGEKGLEILFPMEFPVYQKDESGEFKRDASGKKIPVPDANGNPEKGIWFGVGYVFDVSQTNALEVGAVKHLNHRGDAVAIDPGIVRETALRITKEYGIPVTFASNHGNAAGGWYNSMLHDITINTAVSQTSGDQLGTLFHELGHALLHGKKSPEYDRRLKEGQAEAFAYASASVFGIERKSQLYIKNWIADKIPLQDVMKDIAGHVKDAFTKLNLQELAICSSMSEVKNIPASAPESDSKKDVKTESCLVFTPEVKLSLSADDLRSESQELCRALNVKLDFKNKDVNSACDYIFNLTDNRKLAELHSIVLDGRRDNLSDDFIADLIVRNITAERKAQQKRTDPEKKQTEEAQLALF